MDTMTYEDDDYGSGLGNNDTFRLSNPSPSWSFSRVTDAHHGLSQMTELPGSLSDNDDDDDDDDSNKAVGGGDMSDSDLRLASLTDSPFQGPVYPGTPLDETAPTLTTEFPQHDADEDDLPVVELHVGEEERLD
jgi:ubiquitin carboxyl-terminal hydrolase 4/11/15